MLPTVGDVISGSVTVRFDPADVGSFDPDLTITDCSFGGFFCGNGTSESDFDAYAPGSQRADFGTYNLVSSIPGIGGFCSGLRFRRI